jgi:hypothetical protein
MQDEGGPSNLQTSSTIGLPYFLRLQMQYAEHILPRMNIVVVRTIRDNA